MPLNIRIKTEKDKMTLQRAVASNRLSFKFHKVGSDLRMGGDGCANPDDFRDTKHECFNVENQDKESNISPEESKNWAEFLQNA